MPKRKSEKTSKFAHRCIWKFTITAQDLHLQLYFDIYKHKHIAFLCFSFEWFTFQDKMIDFNLYKLRAKYFYTERETYSMYENVDFATDCLHS